MEDQHNSLIRLDDSAWLAGLRSAVGLWADATSRTESPRLSDLRRDKRRAVESFFTFVRKRPGDVEPDDVAEWRASLEERGLSPNSIYTRMSLLSSFYTWAMEHLPEGRAISNPVRVARMKRPRPYQSESTKSLSDEEVRSLVQTVQRRAASGDLIGKRDLALLLWYLLTGMRRSEVISLRGRDVEVKPDRLIVRGRVKGGTFVGREIRDPDLRTALIDYLHSARRLSVLRTNGPLWTRHDRAGRPGSPLTSHSFALNLKKYAHEAGLEHIHLHQTRHTFARIISEDTGSLFETQEALGHQSPSTTRVYVQRIAVKRDKHSRSVSARIKNSGDLDND